MAEGSSTTGTPIDLQTVDVGGVPAYWVPSDGRMSVALLFGVGVRDESLVVRGIDHLVEHLTLFGLDHRALDCNGHVSPSATAFTVTGSVEEVQTVLDHVGSSLRGLAHQRLEQERRVLRTEARSRGRSLNGLHLEYRFGPNGIGLLDAEELGLRWLGPDQLTAWIGTWFTAGNAALAVSGPDPRHLRLALPPGPRPARAARPVEMIDRPTWAGTPGNVVAISMTSPRSPRWTTAATVLTAVAEHRLRQVEGRSYSVVDLGFPVDAERSYFYLGADCLDEEADTVRDALSAELARLRTRGPTADEVATTVACLRRAYVDDRAAMGAAYAAADGWLLGRPTPPLGEVLAEVEAVTVDDVATALDQALQTTLLTVPFSSFVNDRRYSPLARWSAERVEGTEYRPGSGLDTERVDDRLVIGPDGVTTLLRGSDPVTVRWTNLRAACRFTDRSWVLHGADGFSVTVSARDWFRGGDADGEIALFVPRGLVVDMGEEFAPGVPDTDPDAPLAPGPSASAWRAASRATGSATDAGAGPPPPPGAAAPASAAPDTAASRAKDPSVMGAVVVVWVFAGVIGIWLLSTMGDGSGNRAKLRILGLVLVGAAFATRTLRR